MIESSSIIEVGKFLKPHALKGDMNAYCEYDNEILSQGYPLIVNMDGILVPFYVASVRTKGTHGSLILLDGINNVEETVRFVNKPFYMMRKDVAEFFDVSENELDNDQEFIGYILEDPALGVIGSIVDIDDTTENILLIVEPLDSISYDLLYIPLAEDLIESVVEADESNPGKIIMKIPDGLLNINDKDSGVEILE